MDNNHKFIRHLFALSPSLTHDDDLARNFRNLSAAGRGGGAIAAAHLHRHHLGCILPNPTPHLLRIPLFKSKPHFLDTIVPNLMHSLSLTLKHFFPLSAKVVYPLNSDELPILRYTPGDSVSFNVCESTADFEYFVGNHARDADKFYDLVPQLPPPIDEPNCKLLQLLALQATLFPGRGVCIAVVNHHSAADGTAMSAFINSWASMSKLGTEEEFLLSKNESLPVSDRSLFKHPWKLDSFCWNLFRNFPLAPPSFPLPTNRVRAAFVVCLCMFRKIEAFIVGGLI